MWGQLDLTTAVIFLLIFLIGYYCLTPPSNMPPGPRPLPVVGNLLSVYRAMKSNTILALIQEWRKRYGDTYTIWMGGQPVVVITDYKVMYETLVKNGDIFSGRVHNLYIINRILSITGIGVIDNDGPQWKELRRVTLMAMRDFGLGKKTLEERVQEEARAVVEVVEKRQGQPKELKNLFSKYTSNVISSVIFSNRFEYSDPIFQELTTLVFRVASRFFLFNPINYFSVFRLFPFAKQLAYEQVADFKTLDSMMTEILKEHESSFDPKDIRDFVDMYIKARSESSDAHLYNATNMRRVILDLFIAGTETSSITLDWLTLYMVAYPDVQARCQKEIDKTIGQERMLTGEDRKKLPFVEAVITEVLRLVSVVPLGVPHVATRAGKVGAYSVPQGTIIMANLMEMHREPTSWSNPQVFDPERFLDKDGQFHQPRLNFAPFSLGPRICLGESLARLEIFILFGTLMQTFTFSMAQGHSPDLEGHVGITYSPKLQSVIANRR